jgi:hypothetical protein
MVTRRWLAGIVIVAGLLAATLSDPATAQQKQGKQREQSQDELNAEVVTCIAAAGELKEFGEKYKAPEALIAAGSMLLRANAATKGKLEKLDAEVTDENGKKLDVPAEKEQTLKQQAADLFDQALTMGAKGVDLQGLIKAAKGRKYPEPPVKTTKERGVVGGPKRISRAISAGAAHHYSIPFHSHQVGTVLVQSDHPVRFVVRQANKGVLTSSIVRNGNYSWRPSSGGGTTLITVEIHGTGNLAHYTLVAN